MKLTVLCDNNTITDVYLTGEPALSFFIEDSGKNILFDTGYSDVFIKNAEKLGISLLSLDYIVLSHNHIDHTGGLVPLLEMFKCAEGDGKILKRPEIIAHPLIFRKVFEDPFGDIGCPVKEDDLGEFFDVRLSAEPVKITDNITYLGEIEENIPFEPPVAIGVSEGPGGVVFPDFQPDDTALLYSGEDGPVVITGCSHKGICSVVKQAEKISGRGDFIDVIGGFHLLGADEERLEETGKFFAGLGIGCIHPCHCTDLSARIALSGYVRVKETGCGFVAEYI